LTVARPRDKPKRIRKSEENYNFFIRAAVNAKWATFQTPLRHENPVRDIKVQSHCVGCKASAKEQARDLHNCINTVITMCDGYAFQMDEKNYTTPAAWKSSRCAGLMDTWLSAPQ
jgi:hypothetical protein